MSFITCILKAKKIKAITTFMATLFMSWSTGQRQLRQHESTACRAPNHRWLVFGVGRKRGKSKKAVQVRRVWPLSWSLPRSVFEADIYRQKTTSSPTVHINTHSDNVPSHRCFLIKPSPKMTRLPLALVLVASLGKFLIIAKKRKVKWLFFWWCFDESLISTLVGLCTIWGKAEALKLKQLGNFERVGIFQR